ncbi:hypothetical protein B0H14DRAFT_3470897 [Mycena olivaceomarginata]|nr:hypothetical protein B0H14DRAFT_3470897 [Mycena olivaceomarginata]
MLLIAGAKRRLVLYATGEPPQIYILLLLLEFGVELPASACLMSRRVAPGGSPQTPLITRTDADAIKFPASSFIYPLYDPREYGYVFPFYLSSDCACSIHRNS